MGSLLLLLLEPNTEDQSLLLATGLAEAQAGSWREAMAHLRPAFAASHNPAAGVALLEAEVGAHADHSSTLKDLVLSPLSFVLCQFALRPLAPDF